MAPDDQDGPRRVAVRCHLQDVAAGPRRANHEQPGRRGAACVAEAPANASRLRPDPEPDPRAGRRVEHVRPHRDELDPDDPCARPAARGCPRGRRRGPRAGSGPAGSPEPNQRSTPAVPYRRSRGPSFPSTNRSARAASLIRTRMRTTSLRPSPSGEKTRGRTEPTETVGAAVSTLIGFGIRIVRRSRARWMPRLVDPGRDDASRVVPPVPT